MKIVLTQVYTTDCFASDNFGTDVPVLRAPQEYKWKLRAPLQPLSPSPALDSALSPLLVRSEKITPVKHENRATTFLGLNSPASISPKSPVPQKRATPVVMKAKKTAQSPVNGFMLESPRRLCGRTSRESPRSSSKSPVKASTALVGKFRNNVSYTSNISAGLVMRGSHKFNKMVM